MGSLRRCWRDGAFRILALSVGLAALALASVILLRAELDQRVDQRTAASLGGALVLEGSRAPDDRQRPVDNELSSSLVLEFPTVVVAGDDTLLVSAKAVDADYPLRGELQVAPDRFGDAGPRDHGPRPGHAWVADGVIDRLGKAVGDTLTLGETDLTITGVIRSEPDQGTAFYSVNPRVLMHADDVAASGVIGPGSRLDYRLLVDGPATAVAAHRRQLESAGLRPDQSLEGVDDARVRSFGPLQQLTLYVSVGVLLVVVLCAAALTMASAQRATRQARLAALLRTFGAPRRRVLRRLLTGEAIALLPAAAAGLLLGSLVVLVARQALGWQGPLAAGPADWLLIAALPPGLWLVFGVTQGLALARAPITRLLQRSGGVQPVGAGGLIAAVALLALAAAWLSGSARELAWLIGLLLVLAIGLPAALWPLFKGLDWLSPRLPLASRLALRRLTRRPTLALPLLAALMAAMAVLALSGHVGTRLLADWRASLPERAPNYFLLNVFDADLPALDAWLADHNAIAKPRYPVTRARLTEINDQPVRQAVTKESRQAGNALNRDLVLTETDRLPPSNQVSVGRWHGEDDTTGVSVETELARGLGIALGDNVTFVGPSGELTATVTSLREVNWESFEPNFYFIFTPGTLAAADLSWLTSFWLPPGDGGRLAELLRQMPQATLLDVNTLLDRAQAIIDQASRASALLAALLMAAALLVLAAALMSLRTVRDRDNAMLRVLGADAALLRRIAWREALAWGGLAAIGASLLVTAALWPLGQLLFDGRLPWSAWQLLPAAAALGIALGGLRLGRGGDDGPMRLLAS
ncbi:MAG: hypothetical protein RJQ08_07490 [Salinisphaeraceae bacterium]